MSRECVFIAAYLLALLALAAGLELNSRQSTSAWSSRLFAGHRRQSPTPPAPATTDDWPHSEAHRFHQALTGFTAVVALTLGLTETVRHHRPAEATVLGALLVPHLLLAAVLIRRLRHHRSSQPHSPL